MKRIAKLSLVALLLAPMICAGMDNTPPQSNSHLPLQFSPFEKYLYAENAKLRTASKAWYTPFVTPAILVGLAAVVSLVVTSRNNRRQIEIRELELIQSSFRWLAGGTQDRNIGISVAEHFWDKKPENQSTWLKLFANQAVYLLAEQFDRKAQDHKREPKDILQRLDEELTLRRVMSVILENRKDIGDLQRDYLEYAIEKRLLHDAEGRYPLSETPGRITKTRLKAWKKQLGS